MELKKNFRVRIFSAYYGAQVAQYIGAGKPLIGEMVEANLFNVTVRFDLSKTSSWDIEKCKLVLKSLPRIIDEHAIKVANICDVKSEDKDKLIYIGRGIVLFHLCDTAPWGDDSNTRFPHLDNVGTRNLITENMPSYMVRIIDSLRSERYDCGYGEIPSLIKAGLAIEKEDTDKQS